MPISHESTICLGASYLQRSFYYLYSSYHRTGLLRFLVEITHYKNSYIIYHNWSSFTIIYHHSFTIIMLLPHLLIPLGLTHGTDRGFPRWSNKTPRPPAAVRLPTPSEAARLKKLRRKTWRSRWYLSAATWMGWYFFFGCLTFSEATCWHVLTGALEYFLFFHIGNNHPNWLSYFSEGLKPPTSVWCFLSLFLLGWIHLDWGYWENIDTVDLRVHIYICIYIYSYTSFFERCLDYQYTNVCI